MFIVWATYDPSWYGDPNGQSSITFFSSWHLLTIFCYFRYRLFTSVLIGDLNLKKIEMLKFGTGLALFCLSYFLTGLSARTYTTLTLPSTLNDPFFYKGMSFRKFICMWNPLDQNGIQVGIIILLNMNNAHKAKTH